jgi:hypothetical protein
LRGFLRLFILFYLCYLGGWGSASWFDGSVQFRFYILGKEEAVWSFSRESYADIPYTTTGRKAASFDEQSSRRSERYGTEWAKKSKKMSKSARREKDSMYKLTTTTTTLKSRRHDRESPSSQCCRTNQTVSQPIKQAAVNRAVNQTRSKIKQISKKKKFTHLLRIRKPPLNAKTPPVSPF